MPVVVRKRPIAISIFCVTGFVISAGQVIMISYPGIHDISQWYPVIYGLVVALRFFSLVGVWHMKKWGAELFTYIAITKIIMQVAMSDMNFSSYVDLVFVLPAAVTFMLFHRRMDRNL